MTTPPPSTPAGSSPAAPVPPAAGSAKTKKFLIVAASVVGGLILVGAVGGALGAGRDDRVPAAGLTEVPTSSPTPTPTPEDVAPPAVADVDVERFQAEASRDLDDLAKDLDDMVRTVDEGGFWRLLSNSLEVSFNYGQLSAHTPPPSVADAYAAGLQNLDAAITALSDLVTGEDTGAILAAIEHTRGQAAALRAVVDSAT